ncbi:MAG: PVC-type heme-binding CxxCH protein [Planctomycetota bacterium]
MLWPVLRAAPALSLLVTSLLAQEQGDYRPIIEPASDEGRARMAGFELADGLAVDLFAAEPMFAHPVCLYVADDGAVYVGETFRHHAGVTDIREHWDWLDDDLACDTVQDRIELLRKWEGDRFDEYAIEHDRISVLRDTDGDHVADLATVYADGFKSHETGIGAGLIEIDGDVYYTCIPDLWKLRDTDGDDVADVRESLHTGYGVHIGYLGHDMHGLALGHDGRLYFSIGDRGLHVQTENGVLDWPDTGTVLRCELDGSNLEVVHSGLRNPQELAFDDFGNLFTGDNNGDGGDQARWVQIVWGGDSGWREGYQYVDDMGPWKAEQLWKPQFEGQAAYIIPPLANIASGPSGLTFNPGTALGPEWKSHFFLCDFLGDAGMSGIRAFELIPKGASFELGEMKRPFWGVLATDAAFGPDGALYVSDWVQGWNRSGKGRVYRLFDPAMADDALARETEQLLAADSLGDDPWEIASLLGHPDRRVRLKAQFALVAMGGEGIGALEVVAQGENDEPLLARLHGVWGMGQAARANPTWLRRLAMLAQDPEPEVRTQILTVIGDGAAPLRGYPRAEPLIVNAVHAGLLDHDPRVTFAAAIAAGRLGFNALVGPLIDIAKEFGARDPTMRHAVVMGLLGCATDADLDWMSEDPSVHVRMAALLVMRRNRDPRIARFLTNQGPLLVAEAARAISDVPIPGALADLAALDVADDVDLVGWDMLSRRVIDANFRLGGQTNARALADIALRAEDEDRRIEALELLAEWTEESGTHRIEGDWRPRPGPAHTDLSGEVAYLEVSGILDADEEVLVEYARLAGAHGGPDMWPKLMPWVEDRELGSDLRVAALEAMESLESPILHDVLDRTLEDPDAELRAASLGVLERLDPADALPRMPAALENGGLAEQRVALGILGRAEDPIAVELLAETLDKDIAGVFPVELALDLVLAAESKDVPELAERLERRSADRDPDEEITPFLDTLFGGDRDEGREIFKLPSLSCQRCHATWWDGVRRVGPNLSGVGGRLARLHLLEAIVTPNLRTSPGYSGTNLFLHDGNVISGRVLEENEEHIRIQDSNGEVHLVTHDLIETRRAGLSAMPEGLASSITREEMRDLIQYLAEL